MRTHYVCWNRFRELSIFVGGVETVSVATRPFIRRRLGRELARIRSDSGLTAEEVAGRVVLPDDRERLAASSISRIETAKMSVRPSTIAAILKAYEIADSDERHGVLMRLARDAGSEAFWHPYTGRRALPKWFEMYVDLEAEAAGLKTFDPQVVNGMAQTLDYARAVFKGQGADGVERRAKLRLDRQEKAKEHGTKLDMIIDESVLLRRFGTPEQFKGQLNRLVSLAEDCRLRVLPLAAQTPAVGPFILLEFAEPIDPNVAYVEHESGAMYLEREEQVEAYEKTFERLAGAARGYAESADLIREVMYG